MADITQRRLNSGDGEPIEIGAQAPAFTLRRTFEESVSLSTLNASGPVLLIFYVFDFGHV